MLRQILMRLRSASLGLGDLLLKVALDVSKESIVKQTISAE